MSIVLYNKIHSIFSKKSKKSTKKVQKKYKKKYKKSTKKVQKKVQKNIPNNLNVTLKFHKIELKSVQYNTYRTTFYKIYKK